MTERAQAATRPEDFALQHPTRVRWAETDKQGIVFNGHYLTWFDIAQTEHFRSLGFRYPNGLERFGLDIFVVNANLDYRAPAHFDEIVTLCARVEYLGRTSLRYRMAVFREATLLVEGTITYVIATKEGRVPSPIPGDFIERVGAFERIAPARKTG
jgi:acyl-CoA thioester hydrolase